MQRRSPGADDGVDLVDEEDGVRDLLGPGDDPLEPLLELAAELGSGEQRAHVERPDGGLGQDLGNPLLVDGERQPLGDGGLAHARIAHVDGVVLAAAAEHLDGALELRAAPDERVDLAAGGLLHQVGAEGAEGVLHGAGRALLLLLGLGVLLLVALLLLVLLLVLGHPVGDVREDVEPPDPLLVEEEHGV
jgi:hypothetical protein